MTTTYLFKLQQCNAEYRATNNFTEQTNVFELLEWLDFHLVELEHFSSEYDQATTLLSKPNTQLSSTIINWLSFVHYRLPDLSAHCYPVPQLEGGSVHDHKFVIPF